MSTPAKLSWLWVFAMLNYIYADILTLMDPSVLRDIVSGNLDMVQITPEFLLMGAILMEIPIAMVVLSRILKYRVNRWANIVAGLIKTLAVFASMFVGEPAAYYMFFGVIEITTTLYIIWVAWRWTESK